MDLAIVKKDTIKITEIELKIVTALSKGERTKAIADKHHKSLRTTEGYIAGLMKKVSAKTQAHLVAIFLRQGIIK